MFNSFIIKFEKKYFNNKRIISLYEVMHLFFICHVKNTYIKPKEKGKEIKKKKKRSN